MIELHSWPTPNGHKIHIMLEECGLSYRAHAVDIGGGDQFDPAFLQISPNNKIPAIVDSDGPDGKPISLFESGAILVYLAGKTGRFLPQDVRGKYLALQWLMFQMGSIGPMLGQAHHFRLYAPEKIEYAINRYTHEAGRLYGVMDRRLGEVEYFAGEYSIADIAIFPVDALARQSGRGSCELHEREALVRCARRAARGPARPQGTVRSTQAADGRQGARDALRRHAVRQALRRATAADSSADR